MIAPNDNYRASFIESMLDRYGLAYICQNPLVLFGDAPASARSAQHVRGDARLPGSSHHGDPGYERQDPESLSRRVREAYEILRELYAPWPAQYAEPHTRPSESAKYRP